MLTVSILGRDLGYHHPSVQGGTLACVDCLYIRDLGYHHPSVQRGISACVDRLYTAITETPWQVWPCLEVQWYSIEALKYAREQMIMYYKLLLDFYE